MVAGEEPTLMFDIAFKVQELGLAMKAATISAERAVLVNHPMAWDDDGDAVAPVGPPDGAGSAGGAETECEASVTCGFAEGNPLKRGPDAALKGASGKGKGDREVLGFASEIGRELAFNEGKVLNSRPDACTLTVLIVFGVGGRPRCARSAGGVVDGGVGDEGARQEAGQVLGFALQRWAIREFEQAETVARSRGDHRAEWSVDGACDDRIGLRGACLRRSRGPRKHPRQFFPHRHRDSFAHQGRV